MTNVMFKKPRFVIPKAGKDKGITDIVMFVAGTTDPLNTAGLKHGANTTYWEGSPANFWAKVKELKFQFHDLHIEGTFYSWSGDNNTHERNVAAEGLLDLIKREYPGYRRKEVHLHLIGHSHGGNVINEFTNLITTEKGKAFPEPWKIKSITYLSTPFFQKKHQLNHTKLHKACQLINVHNEYDLTQQFIADFSLIDLQVLIKNFNKGTFDKALNRIKQIDSNAFAIISDSGYFGKINEAQGHNLWRNTVILLDGVGMLLTAIIDYINSIKTNKFKSEKSQFVGLFNRINTWSVNAKTTVARNQSTRAGGYSRDKYFADLNLLGILRLINELMSIQTGENDSYILGVLNTLFAENTGITESIDETSWTPKKQAKGLSILDVPITTSDPYNTRNKKANFDKFLSGVQGALRSRHLKEVLMRLFSQFIGADQIKEIMDKLNKLEWVVSGEEDTQIKLLGKTHLRIYRDLVLKYNANLVAASDLKTDLAIRPGGIPYLATVSHSLSHTQFWPKVEKGLRSAFSSGINTGYQKK